MTASKRAAAAIAATPGKSDGAIASEIGVSDKTVGKASKQTAEQSAVAKRVGKDGEARKGPIDGLAALWTDLATNAW